MNHKLHNANQLMVMNIHIILFYVSEYMLFLIPDTFLNQSHFLLNISAACIHGEKYQPNDSDMWYFFSILVLADVSVLFPP